MTPLEPPEPTRHLTHPPHHPTPVQLIMKLLPMFPNYLIPTPCSLTAILISQIEWQFVAQIGIVRQKLPRRAAIASKCVEDERKDKETFPTEKVPCRIIA